MNTEQTVTEESVPSTEVMEVPADQAAESAPADTKPSETTEETGSEPEKALGEKGNREIARLRKRTQAAEQEAAYQRGRAEALEGVKGGKTERSDDTAADAETLYAREHPEPKRGQFDDDDEYFRAVRKWDRGLVKFEQEQAQTQTRETQTHAEFARTLEAQRTRGEEKYEDFQDLVSTVDFEPATLQALTAADKGEDIAYYLASNPAELERVGKLNPFLQAKEIGRIEAGLESGKIQIKQTTKAPPPPSTLGGKNNTTAKNIFAENLSTEDRIKMRREQRAARGR